MTVGLLLVTHSEIGTVMLETADKILGEVRMNTETIHVGYDMDIDVIRRAIINGLERVDSGDGVLLLTDIYGGTPANMAIEVCNRSQVRVVAGLNMPMLVRVLNYADLSLNDLEDKAITGGITGIVSCKEVGSVPERGGGDTNA